MSNPRVFFDIASNGAPIGVSSDMCSENKEKLTRFPIAYCHGIKS